MLGFTKIAIDLRFLVRIQIVRFFASSSFFAKNFKLVYTFAFCGGSFLCPIFQKWKFKKVFFKLIFLPLMRSRRSYSLEFNFYLIACSCHSVPLVFGSWTQELEQISIQHQGSFYLRRGLIQNCRDHTKSIPIIHLVTFHYVRTHKLFT